MLCGVTGSNKTNTIANGSANLNNTNQTQLPRLDNIKKSNENLSFEISSNNSGYPKLFSNSTQSNISHVGRIQDDGSNNNNNNETSKQNDYNNETSSIDFSFNSNNKGLAKNLYNDSFSNVTRDLEVVDFGTQQQTESSFRNFTNIEGSYQDKKRKNITVEH